jgi:hypothetical protein
MPAGDTDRLFREARLGFHNSLNMARPAAKYFHAAMQRRSAVSPSGAPV